MARKILKALTNNFGFKLLALFFAFILWIVVYNIEDPIKTKTFTTTVTIENVSAVTKDMNKWYEIVEGTNQVSFSVSAKRSILEKLDDTDFTATADFNNIVLSDDGTKGSVHVDIACNKSVYNNSLNFNGKVKNLELSLEALMKQPFKVIANTSGSVADGYALGDVKVTNSQLITVSGPESIVSKVDKIIATINVSGMYEEITDDNIIPVLYDKDGKEIPTTRLTLSSDRVAITAQILSTKEVPINFNTTGRPAGNSEVLSVEGNISSVLVKGSASALNALSSIEVSGDTLDVTDAQEDIVTTVDITEFLPEGISLVNAEDASITVTIKIKTISTRTINISTDNIDVKGLSSDYELKFSSAVLAINVTGDDKDLSELTADKIKGSIDVSALDEGTHTVAVDIKLDEEKYSCDSVAVRVTIKKKSQSSEASSENDTPADETPADNTPDANTPGSDESNNDATDDNSVDEQKNTDKDENEVSE